MLGDLIHSRIQNLGFKIPSCRHCEIWRRHLNYLGSDGAVVFRNQIIGHFNRKLRELKLDVKIEILELFIDTCIKDNRDPMYSSISNLSTEGV